MNARLRLLQVILVCGAAAWPASALLLRTVDAGGGLYVQQVGSQALIHEESGSITELELPQGTLIRRLERLSDGWIAAGEIDALGHTELFLLRSKNGERSILPMPPNDAEHVLRIHPAPLVDDGRLVGLGWIAGSRVRASAVYAAAWNGHDWAPAEQVSPPGPGTQIGLVGTVLARGSWLLVWSAYDGTDDEIVWSRRASRSWTEPRPLHAGNEHPDIVPSVVAAGEGALAAWSSSDGTTYRVRLAAFNAGRWRERAFVGPKASLHPTLTRDGPGVFMLYRTVVPSTWTLLELEPSGSVGRRAVLAEESSFRPGLVPRDEGPPLFHWPSQDAATPTQVELEWEAPE